MGAVFWAVVSLFFLVVYPQIFCAFVHNHTSYSANWYTKVITVLTFAIVLRTIGIEWTLVLVTTAVYFISPLIYDFWKISIRTYLQHFVNTISTLYTSRQHIKHRPSKKRRQMSGEKKDVEVLWKMDSLKPQQTFESGIMPTEQLSSESFTSSDTFHSDGSKERIPKKLTYSELLAHAADRNSKSGKNCKVGSKKVVEQERKATVDIGVQSDCADAKMERRMGMLETRLRMDELRNRTWCSRMTDAEETITKLSSQVELLLQQLNVRKCDTMEQATSTSALDDHPPTQLELKNPTTDRATSMTYVPFESPHSKALVQTHLGILEKALVPATTDEQKAMIVNSWRNPAVVVEEPDDPLYSPSFNSLLRRLRAEAGENTWTRMQLENTLTETSKSDKSDEEDAAAKLATKLKNRKSQF